MVKGPITPWSGLPDELNEKEHAGFVYLIENLITGRKYIGRKYLWSTTRKPVKGKVRRKKVTKESGWRTYQSSCPELIEDIAKLGIENFSFTVLSIHNKRSKVNYEELRQQFVHDVLYAKLPDGKPAYYNGNIASRYFAPREQNEEGID